VPVAPTWVSTSPAPRTLRGSTLQAGNHVHALSCMPAWPSRSGLPRGSLHDGVDRAVLARVSLMESEDRISAVTPSREKSLVAEVARLQTFERSRYSTPRSCAIRLRRAGPSSRSAIQLGVPASADAMKSEPTVPHKGGVLPRRFAGE